MSTIQEEVWRAIRELTEAQKRTEEAQKREQEARRRWEEADRKSSEAMRESGRLASEEIRKLGIHIGRLTDRWGCFVEDLLVPSLVARVREMGFEIERVHRNPEARNGGEKELDAVLVGRMGRRNTLLLASLKSRVQKRDIDDHIGDIERFYDFFRQFPRADRMGAIAGVGFAEGTVTYAQKRGLFVGVVTEDLCRLENPPSFKPRIWPRPGR